MTLKNKESPGLMVKYFFNFLNFNFNSLNI